MEPFEPLVIWDLEDEPQGNFVHIVLEHDVTQDEVWNVMSDLSNETVSSYSSGRPATFGWTRTGRYIIVIWENVDDDPWTIYPVTAFEVSPRHLRRKRKGRRKR